MPNANDADDKTVSRRALLLGSSSLGLGAALIGCESGAAPAAAMGPEMARKSAPSGASSAPASGDSDPILAVLPLGAPPWKTFDPFLFCVHHNDDYPLGNTTLGPNAALDGRSIGQDFAGKDGWSMYHGDEVPGFPRHPHRGFETVTVTRRGHVDHSDSLGATARYGQGDVQWMTAGSGIVHAEMFPLLSQRERNPVELFQIWLNLPAKNKFARPHFSMFWAGTIPKREIVDKAGRRTHLTLIAGGLDGAKAPSPPPDSWAGQADSDVAIWSIRLEPGAVWQLPKSRAGSARTLYHFAGGGLRLAGREVPAHSAIRLRDGVNVTLEAGGDETEILLLQGRPIGEPVVQHGPFVMNQRSQIEDAVRDYQRTQFGGWPWPRSGPVHARDSGRFARHADGRVERA